VGGTIFQNHAERDPDTLYNFVLPERLPGRLRPSRADPGHQWNLLWDNLAGRRKFHLRGLCVGGWVRYVFSACQ